METISLSSSPAALIASDAAEDGDDEGAPVRLHAEAASNGADDDDDEPEPEQLSPEEREERRQLIRKVGRYRTLFAKELSDINAREFLMLPLLALAVLYMGVNPKPFTDVMDASVTELLRHVAVSKLN